MNGYSLTEEEEQELIEMYKCGKYSLKEIKEWFGIAYSTVYRILRKHGL